MGFPIIMHAYLFNLLLIFLCFFSGDFNGHDEFVSFSYSLCPNTSGQSLYSNMLIYHDTFKIFEKIYMDQHFTC